MGKGPLCGKVCAIQGQDNPDETQRYQDHRNGGEACDGVRRLIGLPARIDPRWSVYSPAGFIAAPRFPSMSRLLLPTEFRSAKPAQSSLKL
ncbi:hypothetical protein GCM10017621_06040 [Maricaulis virginensis]|uniref:Uncharacterized protein n=1 Tax=Maricaulis virginensis TaxID=144022 RepID=A0A9W6ILC5_9PROT|nr:hypothetical protein GCM10017621_06040 [Maricaulis virginensis]